MKITLIIVFVCASIVCGQTINTKSSKRRNGTEIRQLSESQKSGWQYLSKTNQSALGFYYYYKADSIKKSKYSQSLEVWIRIYPMNARAFSKNNNFSKLVNEAVEMVSVDCEENTFLSSNKTYYDINGNVLPRKFGGISSHQPIAPDSLVETLKNKICEDY